MILILLTLIISATSQANCPDKIEEGRINCIANNIQSVVDKSVSINNNNIIELAIVVFIQDTLHRIKFDVESNLSKESVKDLQSMINMTDKICVCHMQANAYKHHLQKYLFCGRKHPKLSVKDTVSLLINLQIMSEIFQEVKYHYINLIHMLV